MKMSFASLLVIAFLCLQAVPAASLVADGQAHGFEFHNVTVLVKDDVHSLPPLITSELLDVLSWHSIS